MTRENIEFCESREIHQELLSIVREKMPPEEQLYDLAELFKINPNKVWMIFAYLSKRLTQMTEAFDEVCTELDKLQG